MIQDNIYRGVYIPKDWRMTSQNPGQGHSKFHQPKAIASLKEVMSYQNKNVVNRIAHDLKVDVKKAQEIFEDVKGFLFMAAQKSEEIGGAIPTPTIDEGWHSFVLFTEDYSAFCQKYFGTFLHHLPHREGDKEYTREVLLPSIDAMHHIFGQKPSANWDFNPRPNQLLHG